MASRQDMREFVRAYGEAHPDGVLRVKEPVSSTHEIQAVIMELDRRGQHPIVEFDSIEGHDVPVIGNLLASRRALAFALGVDEAEMPQVYASRLSNYLRPVTLDSGAFETTVFRGEDVDLATLPIPKYYPSDSGPYLTAALVVAAHPETGVTTQGYHRCQVKGSNRLGISLHSRRRMYEYQKIAEDRGDDLRCAIILGVHPLISLGSLAYPPPGVSKVEVVGGLFNQPMELATSASNELLVPAWAEIVIDGAILAGEREDEGPFGEFTGYFTERSTRHVFVADTLSLRSEAKFQSIGSGLAQDHILPLGVLREAEIRNAISRVIPRVQAVHVPTSGCAAFLAFVSIEQTRPGEAKHAAMAALAVDHTLKTIVVTDEDVDVFDERSVLWAISTRVQFGNDVVTIERSLGALLDPAANEEGLTDKVLIDATVPYGGAYAPSLKSNSSDVARAKRIVERLLG